MKNIIISFILMLITTLVHADISINDIITDNGNAYIASNITEGGSGFRSVVQLWNPAESTKVIYVDKITLAHGYCAGLSGMDLRVNTTPLGGTVFYATNKNLSISTKSTAQVRLAHMVEPVTDYPIFEFFPGSCHKTEVIELIPPVKITPGHGLYAANGNNNASAIATFEFREY